MAQTRPRGAKQPLRSELALALATCRSAFLATFMFSGMSNILMLTGSFFMLEVYDRVLPSRSLPTLVVLLLLAGGLYAALGILDMIRSRILVRVAHSLDEAVSERVYDALVHIPLVSGNRGDGIQPLRDLDSIRSFLSGVGPIALFDLPWMPFYLAICFAFHFYIGLTALIGAIILVTLTILTEIYMRHPTRAASETSRVRNTLAEASRRNAEVLVAMGMTGRMTQRWSKANRDYITQNEGASDVAGGFGAFSKVLRLLLQSALLAVGAWLVINQQATAGIIIAGSILGSRALAPVDLVISQWRSFVSARQGWKRLNQLLGALPKQDRADATSAADSETDRRECQRRSTWRAKARCRGCQLSRSKRATVLASSAQPRQASPRWSERWSACGGQPAARSGSTARRWISGRPTLWASTSDISRRMSNFSRARSRRTFPVSRKMRRRT